MTTDLSRLSALLIIGLTTTCLAQQPAEEITLPADLVEPGAVLTCVGEGFQFTEGPAADSEGNVYFTDVRASRIHKWSVDGEITTYREDTNGANGLYFDAEGNLVACEGGGGRVVSYAPEGTLTVIADGYEGQRFNRPNDLWIDPKGGIYFSDPAYGQAEVTQGGEHVYYTTPGDHEVIRVTDNLQRPNGLVGPPSGDMLYIADAGAGTTFRYPINDDGTLGMRRAFVGSGSDGMTLDERGNLYLTAAAVVVYSPDGVALGEIPIPERPTNLTFAGPDGKTLFITARTTVYTLRMAVAGAYAAEKEPGQ